jgi:LysR family transcriptional regulator, hydrogen peroxide-inducible genes activator
MRLAPHAVTLRQLQYVVAVADELSFRRAADACGVSQPALSAQLAELEMALGARLFERDRRRVVLTPAGLVLVPRARELLLLADDLVESARMLGDPLAGTLRIGVIPTISPYLLPQAVPVLRRAFPRLTIAWVEDKTRVLAHDLGAGELDAALLALEADLGDVEHHVIGTDSFLLATPSDHPLAAAGLSPATLEDLRNCDVLLLDEGHCLREQALSFCGQAGVRERSFRATSLPTLAQMVAGGAGVTLLPELAAATETRRSDICLRRFAEPAPRRTIALVWRRRSPLAPALRRLAETLAEAWTPPAASVPVKRAKRSPSQQKSKLR